MNENYLDFDEAVAFLNTNASTLYKWLQSGKVPGYKLGRQWRFLKDELELHLSGKSAAIATQKDALALAALLQSRANTDKTIGTTAAILAEELLWDALAYTAHTIHLQPDKGCYKITYRHNDVLSDLITIQEDFFQALDQALRTLSIPLQDEHSRRAYIQRAHEDKIQIRYQRVDTLMGPHINIQLNRIEHTTPQLAKIVPDKTEMDIFQTWLDKNEGIIILSGVTGSGKTTTAYAFLHYLHSTGKMVFTLEDSIATVLDGINQVALQGNRPDNFDQAISGIMGCDADVLGLIISSPGQLEQSIFDTAHRAATAGHLVILQTHAPSCEAVIDKVKRFRPDIIDDHLLIGISSQILVKADKGSRKAQYEIKGF